MVFGLSSVFLQITQASSVSWLAIIISSITMTIFAITLIITWKNIKENTKATYSQLLRGFHEDLTTRLDKNSVLKTREDCERYANDYLNTVDQIAFLDLNDKLPEGIGKYLQRFFAYGLVIIEWYNAMIGQDFHKIARTNWPNFFGFCEKYNIKTNPDDKLPKIMLDYNKAQEKKADAL